MASYGTQAAEDYASEQPSKEPSIDEYDVEDDDSEVIASRGIVGAPEAGPKPIPLKNVAMKIIEKKKEEEAKAKAEEEEKERLRIEEEEEERR